MVITESGAVRKKEKRDNLLPILVVIFGLVGFVSSWLGVDFGKSLSGNYYRQDGLLTLIHLAVFFFLLRIFWDDTWRESTAKAVTLGCFLASLWAIFLFFRSGSVIGPTFGQPNFLAGYLLVCLPFSVWLVTRSFKRENFFWWLVLICQAGAILMTFSKAGVLGLLLFGSTYFFLRRKKKFWLLGILGVMVVLALFVAGEEKWQPEGRERIFKRGVIAWAKRPIFGWGWANFDYAFESVNWPIKFNNDVYVDKAHTHLLEVLVAEGVVGFLVYATIILKLGERLWLKVKGKWEKTLFLVFLLFLFHSQTNVISINEELIFWLILGIV